MRADFPEWSFHNMKWRISAQKICPHSFLLRISKCIDVWCFVTPLQGAQSRKAGSSNHAFAHNFFWKSCETHKKTRPFFGPPLHNNYFRRSQNRAHYLGMVFVIAPWQPFKNFPCWIRGSASLFDSFFDPTLMRLSRAEVEVGGLTSDLNHGWYCFGIMGLS